jgi:hypothetical protein
LGHQNLVEIVRQVHAEVANMVRSGWNMINSHGMGTNVPYFLTDAASGLADEDFLEFRGLELMLSDMWRVSPKGKVTLIREYWEEVPTVPNSPAPGTWISPNWMTRSLAEIVRHARALTERFDNPTAVSFRFEWHGLRNRMLRSPFALWSMSRFVSMTDDRVATGSYANELRVSAALFRRRNRVGPTRGLGTPPGQRVWNL